MSRFTNQTALITGGTGGLGESHVRTYHAGSRSSSTACMAGSTSTAAY
jgi:3alpha(or 20beta)-hydroxysteroid dehydrogenase